jgi:hypothetical protein
VTCDCKYCTYMRRVWKVKIHHVLTKRNIFYAYDGNTAEVLDPLPVGHARLIVVELAFFLSETCLKWQRQSKVPPNARCISSYDISMQKVNVQWKFTSCCRLWIDKIWQSGAVNSPKVGLMLMTNKALAGHIWSPKNFFKKLKEKFAEIDAWWYDGCITSFPN